MTGSYNTLARESSGDNVSGVRVGRLLIAAGAVGGAAWFWARGSAPPPASQPPVAEPIAKLPPPLEALPPYQGQACGARCGVQRWAVKTLSDPMRDRVRMDPVRTTITQLGALPRPPRYPDFERIAPAEFQVWELDAYLVGWDNEADRDIHLFLVDPDNFEARMVAEIPDPACAGACNSGLGPLYAAARDSLQVILQTPNPNDEPILVRVRGVGFFDRNHGQLGAAPNYIELHPVLILSRP